MLEQADPVGGASLPFVLHWIGSPQIGRGTVVGAADLDPTLPLLVIPLERDEHEESSPTFSLRALVDLHERGGDGAMMRAVRVAAEWTDAPGSRCLRIIEIEGSHALHLETRELLQRVLARASGGDAALWGDA